MTVQIQWRLYKRSRASCLNIHTRTNLQTTRTTSRGRAMSATCSTTNRKDNSDNSDTNVSSSSWSHHWCTLESTPEVFNSLMWRNGIKGAHIQELYSLDQSTFRSLANHCNPVYGFIFLIKPQGSRLSKVRSLEQQPDFSNVYFAQQVIPDACGTQAILSIALNSEEQGSEGDDDGDGAGLDIGPLLRNFKEFTTGFSPLVINF